MKNLNNIAKLPVGVSYDSVLGSQVNLTDAADLTITIVTIKNKDYKTSTQLAIYSKDGVTTQVTRGAKQDFSFGVWAVTGTGSAPDLSAYVTKVDYDKKIADFEKRIADLEAKP